MQPYVSRARPGMIKMNRNVKKALIAVLVLSAAALIWDISNDAYYLAMACILAALVGGSDYGRNGKAN